MLKLLVHLQAKYRKECAHRLAPATCLMCVTWTLALASCNPANTSLRTCRMWWFALVWHAQNSFAKARKRLCYLCQLLRFCQVLCLAANCLTDAACLCFQLGHIFRVKCYFYSTGSALLYSNNVPFSPCTSTASCFNCDVLLQYYWSVGAWGVTKFKGNLSSKRDHITCTSC